MDLLVVVVCNTLTAGVLKIEIQHGRVNTIQEGNVNKFIKTVDQITFSGDFKAIISENSFFMDERI